MLGALLALASAAFFGLNNATVRRGVIRGSVLQAMAITVPLGVPIAILAAWPAGGLHAIAGWGIAPWMWMTLAGVVHFVIGRFGNYKATQLLGATLSTPIQQVSILVALVSAFLFLGETVNALNLVGIALVLVGPMMVMRLSRTGTKAKAFEPDYPRGLFWGAVCALGYGISPLFIALGIDGGGAPASLGGLVVSYCAASIVVIGWVLALGGKSYMRGLDRASAGWFVASALFVGLSQLFRYVALALAPVAVVTPIQRLSVVFRLIFNAILNREHEVFDRWVIVSIFLSVLGAVLLAGDTATLLRWIGLGGGLAEMLARPLV